MQRRFLRVPSQLRRRFAQERFSEGFTGRTMLENIQENMNRLKDRDIIETDFADQMFKLLEHEDKVNEIRESFKETVRNAVFVNDQILLITLNEAINLINTNGFSEELMVDIFQTLAKIVKMRGPHAVVTKDLSGFSLLYDHRFESMVDLFKYCLVYGNYISPRSIARVLRALISLDYKDLEIQEMVQKKLLTSRYLENSTVQDALEAGGYSAEELAKLPLMNKKGFYSRKKLEDLDIHLNQTFRKYVEHIVTLKKEDTLAVPVEVSTTIERHRNSLIQAADSLGLKEVEPRVYAELSGSLEDAIQREKKLIDTLSSNREVDPAVREIEEALERLSGYVAQEKKSLVKVTDSILKLRTYYGQLGQLQKEYYVYENASLMADLLELEENLLEAGIITIADIKRLDREGSLPSENKRLGLVVKQAVNDLGGSIETLNSIQQSEVIQQTPARGQLKSEKGVYSKTLPEALAALADYAYLDSRDVHLENNYIDETIAQVVHPDHHKELNIYKVDKHPVMSLRELFFDPIVDKRKLTTASPVYMKSVLSFNEFMNSLATNPKLNLVGSYRGQPVQAVHLSYAAHRSGNSVLISQLNAMVDGLGQAKGIKLDHFCSYFFRTSGNPMAMFNQGQDNVGFANAINNLVETVEDFDNKSAERKVNCLYSFALVSQMNKTFSEMFKKFYLHLQKDPHHFDQMCSNFGKHWIPIPENVLKMQIIDFVAQGFDLPRNPSIVRMQTEMDLSRKMSSGVEDNRDPVFNSLKDLIKNVFGFTVDSTTQSLFRNKVINETMPLAEVFTKFNYSVFLYLGNFDQFPDGKQISIETELQGIAKQNYFSKVLGRNVKVLNIPHSVFLKNGGRVNSEGKLELLEEDKLTTVIRNIYETVINSSISSKHRCSIMLLAQDQASRNIQSHSMSINWFESLSGFLKALTLSLEKASTNNFQVAEGFEANVQSLRNSLSEFETINMQDVSQVIDTSEEIKLAVYKIAHGISRSSNSFKRTLLSIFGNLKLPKLISKLIEINELVADWTSEFSYTARREGQLNPPIFAGRRQGLDLIDANATKNVEKELKPIEFFNYEVLRSPDFFSYKDWSEKVSANIPALAHLRDTSKQIDSIYGPLVQGLVPSRLDNVPFIHPQNYSLNWTLGSFGDHGTTNERYAFAEEAVNKTLVDVSPQLRSQLAYMVNLDSLKFNLKVRQDLDKVLDNLVSLDVFKALLNHFIKNKSAAEVGRSFKKNLVRLIEKHKKLENELRVKVKFGKRLSAVLEKEAQEYSEERRQKAEKEEKHKAVLEGRAWGFDAPIVESTEQPAFDSMSFDLSEPINIKPSTTVLDIDTSSAKDEARLSGRKALKTKMKKFGSSGKEDFSLRSKTLEGQALVERSIESMRDREKEEKSREEARKLIRQHRKMNAASRLTRLTRGLRNLEAKISKKKQHTFLSTIQRYDSVLKATKAESKNVILRDAEAYEEYIHNLRNSKSQRSQYLKVLQDEIKLNEEVEYWKNIVHRILPRMYRVNFANQVCQKEQI